MEKEIVEATIIVPTQMEVTIALKDDAVVVSQTAEEWEQVSSHRIRLNSKASIDALINALTEFREYI